VPDAHEAERQNMLHVTAQNLVVSIIVHWTDRDGDASGGGLDSETRESLTWVTKPLAIGDELVIQVVESVATTRVRRELCAELFEAKHERACLRATAKKYGYKLVRGAHPPQSRSASRHSAV
jgi:hypothetical protein